MPIWYEGMTADDHARNMADARRQWEQEARAARSMERQWRKEAERLEAMCGRGNAKEGLGDA